MTTKPKIRGLSDEFMDALKTGILKPILDLVRDDNTLDLQIRDDYINIYYRGGNLLRVEKVKTSESDFYFEGYFEWTRYKIESTWGKHRFPIDMQTESGVAMWVEHAPEVKQRLMDFYFTENPHEEREIQQFIVRENNYGSLAKSTDYFICDIEFAQSDGDFRFDMIAAHWPSTAKARKDTKNIGLSFIEVKYGDGALSSKVEDGKYKTAGIEKHVKDMERFLSKPDSRKSVAEQMKTVFNQKKELGLIKVSREIDSFDTEPPEYIFILGNHHPRKSKLGEILRGIDDAKLPFDLKFAVSNFMGFGIYEQTIYSLKDFRERFKEGIHSK